MVAPVTGPYSSSFVSFNLAWSKQKYKQVKPIDRPLPYTFQGGTVRQISGNTGYLSGIGTNLITPTFPGIPAHANAAQLQAYERLRGQVNERAVLGAALAEAGQSCLMIYSRAKQVVDLIRAIKNLDFNGISRVLDQSVARTPLKWQVNPPRQKKIRDIRWTKSFANNWLEFSFGWAPMIGDIYNALDFLDQPFKRNKLKATGFSGPLFSKTTTGSVASGFYSEDTYSLGIRCKTGVEVTINNPNLFLLSSLGLVNPMTVAWELVPFSYVFDWLTTANAFFSSGTDWLGLGLINPYNTLSISGTYFQKRMNPYWASPVNSYTANVTYMQRGLGLYSVPLTIRPLTIPNWRRAANMVSTAVQLVGKFR